MNARPTNENGTDDHGADPDGKDVGVDVTSSE